MLGRWCEPLYLIDLTQPDPASVGALQGLWAQIDRDIVLRLLAEPDWRPRQVAAYLIALKRLPDFDDVIGRLLLRSDVCIAGRAYCLALTESNTPAARGYLQRYLDYYLTRPELRFDQDQAMAAIALLDQINKTDMLPEYRDRWNAFVADKPSLNLQRSIERFRSELAGLDRLCAHCG